MEEKEKEQKGTDIKLTLTMFQTFYRRWCHLVLRAAQKIYNLSPQVRKLKFGEIK